MSWEKSNYTAAGAALLSESLSGGALVITRAVSGTGTRRPFGGNRGKRRNT